MPLPVPLRPPRPFSKATARLAHVLMAPKCMRRLPQVRGCLINTRVTTTSAKPKPLLLVSEPILSTARGITERERRVDRPSPIPTQLVSARPSPSRQRFLVRQRFLAEVPPNGDPLHHLKTGRNLTVCAQRKLRSSATGKNLPTHAEHQTTITDGRTQPDSAPGRLRAPRSPRGNRESPISYNNAQIQESAPITWSNLEGRRAPDTHTGQSRHYGERKDCSPLRSP